MGISDTAKSNLRHKVLELRSSYRTLRAKYKELQKEADDYRALAQLARDQIRDLQTDCGDAIEIDPQEKDGEFPNTDDRQQDTSHERAGVFTNGDPR
jgi:hypothetical protein